MTTWRGLFCVVIALLCGLRAGPTAAQQASAPEYNPANGHWYQAVQSPSAVSWYQAQAAAVALTHAGYPGHLLTITSADEQAFIERSLPVARELYWWVGAYQDKTAPDYREPGGGWRWVTGEPFFYAHWFPGEPNNDGTGEDALEFDAKLGNLWNDFPLLLPLTGFLVEYEPLPVSGSFPAAQLTVFPNPVVGGQNAVGQVTLPQPAGPGGVIVTLTSSSLSAAAPAVVTVPPDATTVTFTIVTFRVGAPTPVTLTASCLGAQATTTFQVVPTPDNLPTGNLLVNGSFEEPDSSTYGDGVHPIGPGGLPGWRITRGTVDVVHDRIWDAAPGAGRQSLDLVGTPGAGTIEQSVPTEPGREYLFSGWISHNVEIGEGRADVFLNDQFFVELFHSNALYGKTTLRDMRWVPFAYRFRATAWTTTLKLADVTNLWDAGGGAVLDGLSVAPVGDSVPPAALAAPSGLIARAVSASQINLEWTDNSSAETGFAIYRRLGAGDWTRIAVVGANVTRYADLDVRPNSAYVYRMQAVSDVGASGWSNEAAAFTGFSPTVPGFRLLVTSHNTHSVLRYDGRTGAFLDAFVPSDSGGQGPSHGLVFGPDGNLYVGDVAIHAVRRYDGRTGAFLDLFVLPGSGGLSHPDGMLFGPDGNLYISSYFSDSVLRYDGRTGAFLGAFVSPRSGGLQGPSSLWFGPDGHLYVASEKTDSVLRYDRRTGTFLGALVPSGSGGLAHPSGAVLGPDGQLYVSSYTRNTVMRYDSRTGAFLGVFIPAGSGGLDGPTKLRFGPDGALYVVSQNNNRVLRYDGQTGAFIDTFVVPGSGGLDGPTDLAFLMDETGLPLAAPSRLFARAVSATHVLLTWRDNSSDEHAFAVWRRTEYSDWTRLAVLVPNTTTFLDRNVAPGVTYAYRVRATRGNVASGWSNEASVTTFSINGVAYGTTDARETLTATFTQPDGGVTASYYQGNVLLRVTGVGQAYGSAYNDAFYLFTAPFSSPQNGHDGGYYQLTFGTSPLTPFNLGSNARNFLVGALPGYNPAHDYTFILDTRLYSPGRLHFGVSDGGYSDNTGAYTIAVTQLVPIR